jgi:hypothetical protein
MAHTDMLDRLLRGATAGFAGTLALQVMRTASAKALPATMPPIRQDPGEFMVEQAEKALPEAVAARVPPLAETAAAKAVAAGYGLTAGIVYGLLRPEGGDILVDGIALGLGTWAAGYLGWLPALGLMPAVPDQDAPEVLGPVLRHAVFGIVVVAAFNRLSR